MSNTSSATIDARHMARAVSLALRGEGFVEPNPMVGCVIAKSDTVLGEGYHQKFGGPHAEVVALQSAAKSNADVKGATMYVTLEPCCHQGKTPPCTAAVIDAGIERVVVAMPDPFAEVDGSGLQQLRAAGIDVEVGLLQASAEDVTAPYCKLVRQQRPWVIAKWAMTLDGKLATRTGHSQWISSPLSRQVVHDLRARVDAIIVGKQTALADDPLLTSRTDGPPARIATRIVMDSHGSLPLTSQLVQTADETSTLVAVGPSAEADQIARLEQAGCEVLRLTAKETMNRAEQLLDELGARRMTNVLVEGGGQILGCLRDLDQIDEAHVFIATKLAGGSEAVGPMAGLGVPEMSLANRLQQPTVERWDDDIYVHGRTMSGDGK